MPNEKELEKYIDHELSCPENCTKKHTHHVYFLENTPRHLFEDEVKDEAKEQKPMITKKQIVTPSPRILGKTSDALMKFYMEGKRGKSIGFATPEGTFLSPKAVEDALAKARKAGAKQERERMLEKMDKILTEEWQEPAWNFERHEKLIDFTAKVFKKIEYLKKSISPKQ